MLALFAWLGPAPRSVAGETLTVLTWNVENYLAEDRMVDGEYRTGYPKPEASKMALRAVVRELQPDVLALQEMGTEPYLVELQRDLAGEGADYPYRAWVDGPDPQRHVTLLARVALRRVVPQAKVAVPGAKSGAPELVRRGVLEVTVGLGADEVTLFIVHLKSRYTSDPADPLAATQRQGEAEAVRELVLRRFPRPESARFLVLGDCNDTPRSRPVQALLRRGATTITAMLPAADARGDAWTHHFRREDTYSRVDYVLVSPGLRPAVARCWIFDSPEVRAASDHRPVLVTLAAE